LVRQQEPSHDGPVRRVANLHRAPRYSADSRQIQLW
jgi:hypothetical protein